MRGTCWQVISDKYWTVALDGLVVGEKGITGVNATGAVMDTGTSLITASDDDALLVNSVRNPLRWAFMQAYLLIKPDHPVSVLRCCWSSAASPAGACVDAEHAHGHFAGQPVSWQPPFGGSCANHAQAQQILRCRTLPASLIWASC